MPESMPDRDDLNKVKVAAMRNAVKNMEATLERVKDLENAVIALSNSAEIIARYIPDTVYPANSNESIKRKLLQSVAAARSKL